MGKTDKLYTNVWQSVTQVCVNSEVDVIPQYAVSSHTGDVSKCTGDFQHTRCLLLHKLFHSITFKKAANF